MKTLMAISILGFVLIAATPIFSLQVDPGLRGFWILNVDKSDFSGRPKPKMGLVNWGSTVGPLQSSRLTVGFTRIRWGQTAVAR